MLQNSPELLLPTVNAHSQAKDRVMRDIDFYKK